MTLVRPGVSLVLGALVAAGCVACADDPAGELPIDPADVDWEALGLGVAYQEIPGSPGNDVLIAYGGYTARLEWTQAWAQELYRAHLRDLGVRDIYAVQGPADPGYAGEEIANSSLAAHLVSRVGSADRIHVVAHSSGAFVAHELLRQLTEGGADPAGVTADLIAYYNLDGGGGGFGATQAAHLGSLSFVYAVDGETRSPNAASMIDLAARHPGSNLVELDASASGCDAGAEWCVHDAVIVDHPHDPTGYDLGRDYQDFDADHRVVTGYF